VTPTIKKKSQRGFGLIILVMLIAVSAILIASTTLMMKNAVAQIQLQIDQTKAYYLAQSGVMRAIHNWFISSATDTSRRYAELNTTITGNQIFKTGSQANFAYFSFNSADWQTSNTILRAWNIRNIHSTNSITVKSVKISWSPAAPGVNLNRIRLANTTVASGPFLNGATIPLTLSTLTSGSAWGGNNTNLRWTGNPTATGNITINAQWTFNDDSATKDSVTHNVLFWNGAQAGAGLPGQHTFSVTSTGQVNQSGGQAFKVLSTVKATVSGDPSSGNVEVIDWEKVDKNIP